MKRLYCSVRDIYNDLAMDGASNEAELIKTIEAASQYIEQHIGVFIPMRETRKFDGECEDDLMVPPLLRIVSISTDGVSLTTGDYFFRPQYRHWPNGPFSSIELNDEGTVAAFSGEDEGVVIDGYWGLYDETFDLSAAITSANSTNTSLTVGDGSKCSPGMVLLVETEQMLVLSTGAATTTTATTNGAIAAEDAQITVSDGTKINVGEIIKIDFEQMRVIDIQTNSLLVTRGWNQTTKAAHTTSTTVYAYRTYNVARGANGTTAAAHTSAAGYQQVPPADINYLCRQIAALMMKKKSTGYVGRSGNDELGSGFFVNEFPKNQVDAVKANYFWPGV